MNTTKTMLSVLLCAGLSSAFAATAFAQQGTPAAAVKGPNADNTAVNARDKADGTLQPTDQPNDAVDIKLAASVRRAIVGDKSLSMSAHNVKLVAANGVVTLRGPVTSDTEKVKVGQVAMNVRGVSNVDNQLDVKTN